MLVKLITLAGLVALAQGASMGADSSGDGTTASPHTTILLPTLERLACETTLTNDVETECQGKDAGFQMVHPDNDNFFITCDGVGSRCQRCDGLGELVFNPTCKMCLSRDEECPIETPTSATPAIPCPDDGCPFCGAYTFEAHANKFNYCWCIGGVGTCMPCACGTKYSVENRCCVTDMIDGREC